MAVGLGHRAVDALEQPDRAAVATGANPELPPGLSDAYHAAWRELVTLGLRELETAEDPTLVTSILGVIAIGKGQFALGQLAIDFDESERREMIEGVEQG